VCLDLFQAWASPAGRQRLSAPFNAAVHDQAAGHLEPSGLGEAEAVAWRLGTSLGWIRWADGATQQAQLAGALALFEAWRATLPGPAVAELADALNEAWDAVEKTRTVAGGGQ
jgi:hypothetical protein